jgi:hypothetical protein
MTLSTSTIRAAFRWESGSCASLVALLFSLAKPVRDMKSNIVPTCEY